MKLSILQWNIRHYNKNKPSLSHLLSNSPANIICLQETWLNKNSKPKLTGYNLITSEERESHKGGGVAIFASIHIPCR